MRILVFLLVFHNVTGEQLNRVLFLIFSYEASNDSSVEELSSFTQESRVQSPAEAVLFFCYFLFLLLYAHFTFTRALLRESIIYIHTYFIIENFACKIFNYKISMYVYDRFAQ